MVRDNHKIKFNTNVYDAELVQDYDAVSLYPSAMSKLWITDGVPSVIKGEFTHKDFQEWCTYPEAGSDQRKKYNDMIVHVTKLHTNIQRHFPMLCVKDETTGLNNYKNFDHETVDIWVNSIDLFNLIDFQNAEFEWDIAVVWEGERHYEVREMIQKLFQFRADNKNHPIQAAVKLIMNSIYGKSTMKAQKTKRVYVEHWNYRRNNEGGWDTIDNWDSYFKSNASIIKSFEPLQTEETDDLLNMEKAKHILVKLYNRDMSSSFNIFGSNVLAMARRIIGRVMALAEDIEATFPDQKPRLFYTDTDSMHITDRLLERLVEAYREKYGQELQGRGLCQFHIDFDPVEGENVRGATESIFLAKKMYADKLLTESEKIGYHFRMKGIPNKALTWDKYLALWLGQTVEFEITDYQVSFFYDGGHVGSRPSMRRNIGLRAENENEGDINDEYVIREEDPRPSKKSRTDESDDDKTVPYEEENEDVNYDADVSADVDICDSTDTEEELPPFSFTMSEDSAYLTQEQHLDPPARRPPQGPVSEPWVFDKRTPLSDGFIDEFYRQYYDEEGNFLEETSKMTVKFEKIE